MFNISSWWKNRPRQQFSEMPQWLLAILGGGAFLVAGYVGLALNEKKKAGFDFDMQPQLYILCTNILGNI